jgi:quinolinate synthase
MVHPECTEPVKELSDQILSTGQMLKFAAKSTVTRFIVGTEVGIIHALKRQSPDKEFYPASNRAVCPNMKLMTLEKVAWALEDMQYKVAVPQDIRTRAQKSLDRMVGIKSDK